LLTVAVITDWS